MNWQSLLNHQKEGFYTQCIMTLSSVLVIVLYFLKKDKVKSLGLLAIIAITSLLESLASDFLYLTNSLPVDITYSIAKVVYPFVEIICCTLFIKRNVQSPDARRIIQFSPIILLAYAIIRLLVVSREFPNTIRIKPPEPSPIIMYVTSSSLYIIEGFLILLSALYFFYEWTVKYLPKVRHNLSAIWAISGMLILSGALTPLSLFSPYLFRNITFERQLWAVNYIVYTVFFIAFVMAIITDKKTVNSEIK